MIPCLAHYSAFALHREGRLNPEEFPAWARDHGASALEPLQPCVGESDRVAEAIRATGLPVAAYAAKNDFADPDPAVRAAYRISLRNAMTYARALGAPVVRVFAGDVRSGESPETAWAWLVDGLAQAALDARAVGVRLGLENHGQLVGTAHAVLRLIEEVRTRVGQDTLGLTVDIGNFLLAGNDPLEAVALTAPNAVHVHVKDFRPSRADESSGFTDQVGRIWQGCGLGEGVVDVSEALGLLRRAGYSGAVSLEYEGPESCEEAVPRSLAWLSQHLH